MAKNTIVWTGDAADAVRSVEELKNRVVDLEDKLKRATAAGQGGLKGMAREAAGMVMQFVSVGAVISQVTAALRAMREERAQAAEGARGIEEARGALAQLAGGDPAQLERMYTAASASRAQGLSPELAYNLQWQLEIAGMQADRDLYAGLYPKVADPAQLVGGIRTIRRSMGAAETGTTREVLNKLMAAAAPSPITIEQFGPAMAAVASGGSALGYSDEDLMATLSMMAEVAPGTGEAQGLMAATRLRGFMKTIQRKGIQAESPLAAARQIEAMGMPGQALQRWMGGRIQGFYGYRDILQQGGRIEEVSGEIAAAQAGTGGPGDLVSGMNRVFASNKLNAALGEARVEKALADLVTEDALAPAELRRDAAYDRVRSEGIQRGYGPVTRFIQRREMAMARFLGAPSGAVETVGEAAGYVHQVPVFGGMIRAVDALFEAGERLSRAGGQVAQDRQSRQRAATGGEY